MARTLDDMPVNADMLIEAIIERDLPMCREIIRNTSGKHGAAALILTAIYHVDHTADAPGFEWLAKHLA